MDYCAEVSFIRCNNGCKLPMEIAFAQVDKPRQVFILHMRMPHDVYFTIADLVCNKSQLEGRNKAFNVNARCILKMDNESWWHTLQQFIHDQMGWDARLAVRSKNQKRFFTTVGGFRNVCIVNPPMGNHAYGCNHSHNRLVSFPCAAKVARTLAMNLNKTPRAAPKKTNPCLGETMDQKLLEHVVKDTSNELLEKLLAKCPMENKPLEATENPLEQELMDHCPMDILNENKALDKLNEDKGLESMEKPFERDLMNHGDGEISNEENLLEHCAGCHEVLQKSVEHCPMEDKILDKLEPMDNLLGENTNKELSVETMERVDEAMECSEFVEEALKCGDLEVVAMECCEELLDNAEKMLAEKEIEVEDFEKSQPEKVIESSVDLSHDEKVVEPEIDAEN
ncbi:uncharacterized protein TNCT_379511 [Trichonephila clavata]|uniref:Uncharacterized protein n=1 Tax=Trichonephila clavata TaxID=2740835 RepID=A0A8X6L9Q1_TRICU|nr:uncharacterized protein TNCT_379511 [Trichonephila clavata]